MPRTGLTADQVRKKAIKRAQSQLREFGFEKLRFSDVAKYIGVSHVALYAHFKDKTELLDAVTESWLIEMDGALDRVCAGPGTPQQKIVKWFIELHRYKLEKIKNDPELFKAFDCSALEKKPATEAHHRNLHRQLRGLIEQAFSEKLFILYNPEKVHAILLELMVGFYHPRILYLHLHERREPMLKRALEVVLGGLGE
jgi:AcrR family transcriptional regulator